MFEPEMVAVLEQARGLGQGGAVMVESAEFDYIVDLDAMEQENQRTGNVRKVQRLDTGGAEPVRKRPAAVQSAIGSWKSCGCCNCCCRHLHLHHRCKQNEQANRCGQEPEPEPADDDDEDVCSVCFAGPCAWGMSRFGCEHKFCGDCIRGTLDAVSCATISLVSGLHASKSASEIVVRTGVDRRRLSWTMPRVQVGAAARRSATRRELPRPLLHPLYERT